MALPAATLPSEDPNDAILKIIRSSTLASHTRPGNPPTTMFNPYHFYKTGDFEQHQALAASLLERVYAIRPEGQAVHAEALAEENQAAGPYMLWEAFVTGHVEIYQALKKTFAALGWEQAARNYEKRRNAEVFQASSEVKFGAIRKWLEEFQDDGTKLMFQAAVHGDEATLKVLLDAGYAIHDEERRRLMPMHAACYNGHLGAAKLLHGAGIDLNHLDEFGGTPLMRAAAGGNGHVVVWLVDSGANVNIRETREAGSTALELGARDGGCTAKLVQSGAEYSPAAFAAAVSHGDDKSFGWIANAGGFPVAKLRDSEAQTQGLSDQQRESVILAIKHFSAGSLHIMSILLASVALSREGDRYELDPTDDALSQALRRCIPRVVQNNHVEVARLLIRNLPDDKTSGDSEQAKAARLEDLNQWLILATRYNATSVARMLLEEYGLDSNGNVGPRLETPLAVAGSSQMIQLLVQDFGADIQKAAGPFANGPTPLWHMVQSQNEGAARALLELGGPVDCLHQAVQPGAKRLWLVAGDKSPHQVSLGAWMSPDWFEEDNKDQYLCLEFTEGFEGEIRPRNSNAGLAAGDGRPVYETDQNSGWLGSWKRWLKWFGA